MGKAVKTDIEYKEILEKSLSAIQYLRIHGFSTYMDMFYNISGVK